MGIVFQMHDFAFNLFLVLNGTFAFVGQPSPQGGSDSMLVDWVAAAASVHPSPRTPPRISAISAASGESSPSTARKSFLASVGDSSMTWLPTEKPTTPKPFEVKQTKLWPYKLIGHSNYFGEFECISGKAREATVRCEQAGVLLVLRKLDFFELVEEFPQFGDFWAAAASRRESQRRQALKRLQVRMSFRNMAVVTIQRAWRRRREKESLETCPVTTSSEYARQVSNSSSFAGLVDKGSDPPVAKHILQMSVQGQGSSQVIRQVQDLHRTVCQLRHDIKELRGDYQAGKLNM